MKSFYLYLFLLLSIPLLPNSFSIDVIGVHWFALSIINFVFLSYLIFYKQNFSFPFKFSAFRFHISFLFFCVVSLFFSKNLDLSIVDISRIVNTFLSSIILYNLCNSKLNFHKLSLLISFFLLFDIFFSFKPYIFNGLSSNINFFTFFTENFDPGFLKGLVGNKNIAATYVLVKIPFLLYSISVYKSRFLSGSLNFLLFLSLTTLFLFKSRGAYVSLFFISFLFIIHSLYYYRKGLYFPIILVSSFLISLLVTNSSKSSSVLDEVATISLTNESSSSRFLLWQNTLESSLSNYFIGNGIGTWKIESLPYWNTNGTAYIVPYHAHNDFFELLTEVGLLGSLSYLFIFIFSFLIILKHYRLSKSLIDFTIGAVLLVYFFDANLNFPLERTVLQIVFAIVLFLTYNRYDKETI